MANKSYKNSSQKSSLPKLDAGAFIRSLKEAKEKESSPVEALQAMKIKPIIALFGEGSYRPLSLINLLSDSLKELDIRKTHGESLSSEKSLSELRIQLQTEDFFSKGTLVCISNIHKVRATVLPKLLIDCTRMSPKNIVVFTQTELLSDAQQKKIAEHASFLEVSKLSPPQLEKWVLQESKKREIDILPAPALARLIKDCRGNTDNIVKVLDKLSLANLPGESIQVSHVAALTDKHLEATMFQLFDCIAKKDRLLTSLTLQGVLSSGNHPLQVFAFLSKAFKTLYAQSSAKSHPNGEQSKDLHNSWFYNKLSPRRFNQDRIAEALVLLSALELRLKGNTVDQELYFDWVAQKL